MYKVDLSPLEGPRGERIVFGPGWAFQRSVIVNGEQLPRGGEWWDNPDVRYSGTVDVDEEPNRYVIAALIFPDGEVREQSLITADYGRRLSRQWRTTALRRWGKLDASEVTPLVLTPSALR